ncbi:hypothetical protein D3C80_1207250 [compost metagenome]
MFIVEIARSTTDTGIDKTANTNLIADLEFGYIGTNSRYDADDLMSWYNRIDCIFPFVANSVNIRVANATILD